MARAGRIAAFDLLRAAAIFGVVWIHGCDTSAWALRMCRYASVSVPLFILISFFLMQSSAIRHPEEGAWTLLRKRLGRLLPAYAVWSAAYVAVRLAKRALLPSADLAALDPVSVVWLGGASYQLYFIAALIYWSALFLPLIGLGARHSRRGPAGAVALAAAGAGMLWTGARVFARVEIAPEHSLFAHALLLTGYVPLGMAIALGLARRNLAAPPLRAFSRACAAGGGGGFGALRLFPGDARLGERAAGPVGGHPWRIADAGRDSPNFGAEFRHLFRPRIFCGGLARAGGPAVVADRPRRRRDGLDRGGVRVQLAGVRNPSPRSPATVAGGVERSPKRAGEERERHSKWWREPGSNR